MSPLPLGWRVVRLGDVADTQLGKMLDRSRQTELDATPYLRNINVRWGDFDLDDVKSMGMTATEMTKFSVRRGDVLVCEGGEPGRAAVWRRDEPFAIQKSIHRVRVGSHLDPDFLRYYLEFAATTGRLDRMVTGVTINHLTQEKLRQVEVPLPPVAEQRCIVKTLEEQLSRLKAASASLASLDRLGRAYGRSGLQAALQSVPVEWRPLSQVLRGIEAGRSFTCLPRQSEAGEWGVIKVSAMTWGHFLPSENKAVPAGRSVEPRFQIMQGDILVSRANTEQYVGAPVIVKEQPDCLLLSDKSLRLLPAQGVNRDWLIAALQAPSTRRQVSALATGTKDSMRNISQKALLSVQVPVPTSDGDQAAVSTAVGAVHESRERLESASRIASKRRETLRRALLQAALSGALTREFSSV